MNRLLLACAGIAILAVYLAQRGDQVRSPAKPERVVDPVYWSFPIDPGAAPRSEAERAELREKFNEEWRAVMERLERGCDLVGPGPLNYPDDWDAVSQRKSR